MIEALLNLRKYSILISHLVRFDLSLLSKKLCGEFMKPTLLLRRFLTTEVKKVKLSLCLTNLALRHESVWGSGCIDPHFLDLGTGWR
jgi:hypothetical protein